MILAEARTEKPQFWCPQFNAAVVWHHFPVTVNILLDLMNCESTFLYSLFLVFLGVVCGTAKSSPDGCRLKNQQAMQIFL